MKRRHLVMAASLAAALALVVFGDRTPAGDVVESVTRDSPLPQPQQAHEVTPQPAREPRVLRLVPRGELLGEGANDDDVFGRRDWSPPPPEPVQPPPPPPPTAPPLPFAFIGKKLSADGWEVYIAQGERVHVVRLSDVVDGIYRVDAIAPPTLTMTYLPLNQAQVLPIGAAQ